MHDSMSGPQVYVVLDLTARYAHFPMREQAIAKTAFACSLGLYKFTGLLFGLKNVLYTMQRALDLLLAGYTWEICLVNHDSFIVFGVDFD